MTKPCENICIHDVGGIIEAGAGHHWSLHVPRGIQGDVKDVHKKGFVDIKMKGILYQQHPHKTNKCFIITNLWTW